MSRVEVPCTANVGKTENLGASVAEAMREQEEFKRKARARAAEAEVRALCRTPEKNLKRSRMQRLFTWIMFKLFGFDPFRAKAEAEHYSNALLGFKTDRAAIVLLLPGETMQPGDVALTLIGPQSLPERFHGQEIHPTQLTLVGRPIGMPEVARNRYRAHLAVGGGDSLRVTQAKAVIYEGLNELDVPRLEQVAKLIHCYLYSEEVDQEAQRMIEMLEKFQELCDQRDFSKGAPEPEWP